MHSRSEHMYNETNKESIKDSIKESRKDTGAPYLESFLEQNDREGAGNSFF